MTDSRRAYRIFAFIGIVVALVLFCAFLLPRLLVLVLPFIIGFLIAKIIEPLVELLEKKVRLPRQFASGIAVILVLALLIWIVVSIFYRVVAEITNLVSNADEIAGQITRFLSNTEAFLGEHLGGDMMAFISSQINTENIGMEVSNYLTGYIEPTLNKLLSIVKSLPNTLVFLVVLFLGTYFMSADNVKIRLAMKKIIPQAAHPYFRGVKREMSHALMGYIRAQLILMLITFVECTTGFVLVGGNLAGYALILGITISIIDALPILGTGTVLIPWGLGAIFTGNVRLGLYLLVLYGICFLVRQLLEPKIISGQIGLHPLVTLMAMYAGLRLIGFLGMILGPVLALVIKNIAQAGVFTATWNLVWYGKNGQALEQGD